MKGQPIIYNSSELSFIRDNCILLRSELHNLFISKYGRHEVTKSNINSLCKRNGWMTGRTGCFKKGNIPHPDAGPKGPNKTSFKKGNRPNNWKPLGSTRFSKDGYLEVKTKEPCTWEQKHVLVWEVENGKTPDGFCVSFIDGNKERVEINNLELISRNENLQINRLNYMSQPEELKPSVRAIGKLVAKTIQKKTN